MKKYEVNVHYDVVLHETVYANSEDEAISRAEDQAEFHSLNSGDAFSGETCVCRSLPVSENEAKSVIFNEVLSGRDGETDEEIRAEVDKYIQENPKCLDEEEIDDVVAFVDQALDEKLGIY